MRLSLVQKLEAAHDDSIWSVAWAPGADPTLVTGSVDETVKLWREAGDALVQHHALSGVGLGAVSVAADDSGAYGAVCSLDSTVTVWSMGDYRAVAEMKPPPSEAWGVAFAPGGGGGGDAPPVLAVAGGSSNTVRLADARDGKQLRSLEMPAPEAAGDATDGGGDAARKAERFTLSVAWSPDGRRLAAAGMDGGVAVFDAESGTVLHRLGGHRRPVRAVAWTPDGRHVLTGCDDAAAHMYDAAAGALVEALCGHEAWVLGLAVHPAGGALATVSSDHRLRLWDLATRTCAQAAADHGDQVWGAAWRPDGARLATVGDDRAVCLYDFAA